MKILVIEDDSFKYSKIAAVVGEFYEMEALVRHDNVCAAVNYLRLESPTKIILDMSLPSHPAVAGEGNPISMPVGGVEIILELKSLGKTEIPIIILTQYADIEVEYEYYTIEESEDVIKKLYGIKNLSVAHYDNDSDDWQFKTREFLKTKL